MKPVINVDDLEWQPHKMVKGVKIKVLISKAVQGTDVTCMLVKIGQGIEVPEHIHENSDDILYILSGKATMAAEGSEDFVLEPGVIVRVPKGTKHRIYDVSEDLLIYDVFWPALL